MAYKGKHEAPSGRGNPAPRHRGESYSGSHSRESAPAHGSHSRGATPERRAQPPQRNPQPRREQPVRDYQPARPARPANTYQQPPRRKKKKGFGLRNVIHIAAIVGLVVVGFLIVRHLWWDKRSDKLNEELQQAVELVDPAPAAAGVKPAAKPSATPKASATPAPSASPTPTPSPTPEPTPTPETAPIKVDFKPLQAQNKDVVAWLYCEDTKVNYAVVQREGDNEYYLDHLLNGEVNEKGTVFIDKRNKTPFEEWNTILYGHNMKDDTMFGIIDEYGQQEFYEEHPIMYIITPDKDYKVEICCSFLTGLESTTFEFPRTDGNPAKTIDDITKYSYIDTGIIPTLEDKLVSFSTCYEEADHRYVVIGVLRELERIG